METLLTQTLLLLEKTNQTRRQIAVGAGVGKDWLDKFAQGRIDDPGIKRIQALHDYLTAKDREAAA